MQSHFYSDFNFKNALELLFKILYFCISTKTSPDVSEARYWYVKHQFLQPELMTKLFCSAVYSVNPSLQPTILLRTHGRWQDPPTLVMANSANMAVSLSQSKGAVRDSVKFIKKKCAPTFKKSNSNLKICLIVWMKKYLAK